MPLRTGASRSRAWAIASSVVGLQLALIFAAKLAGFTHISDDDFSRVVIAEDWARSPRFDASGTSWLPVPFWIAGTAMRVFGRTLDVARASEIAVHLLATALLFAAARTRFRSDVRAAVFAAACCMFPWAVWTASTTTPEYLVLVLVGAGLLLFDAAKDGDVPTPKWKTTPAAALIALACLSRYEAWAVAAVIFIAALVRARHSRVWLNAAALVAIAPLAWMRWNLEVHGDALHFIHRVTRFRQAAIGMSSLAERLLFYPRAVALEAPELALLFGGAIVASFFAPVRKRAGVAVASFIAVLAFTIYGSVRDGAPTHHATRATLVAIPSAVWILMETWEVAKTRAFRRAQLVFVAVTFVVAIANAGHVPGKSLEEERSAAIALGRDLRARDVPHVRVTPCAYEHFAMLAAFGFPERATLLPLRGAPSASSPWNCPSVEEAPAP